jgi:hypothetical protein
VPSLKGAPGTDGSGFLLGIAALANDTADRGKIALQAEGTEVEFRRVESGPLPPAAR